MIMWLRCGGNPSQERVERGRSPFRYGVRGDAVANPPKSPARELPPRSLSFTPTGSVSTCAGVLTDMT